jgi:mycothiol synthase
MSSSLREGLTVRAASDADADAVSELIAAADTAVQGWSDATPDELRNWWRRNDPAQSSWLVEDDGLVAYADYFEHGDRGELDGYVHPDRKGEGLGSWLVDRGEERAEAGEKERLQTWCLAGDADARSLFEQRAFGEIRRYYRMLIELDVPPLPAEWPEGMRVATFREQDARAFYDALQESFEDEWNFVREPYERWQERRPEAPDFDPTLWFLVWDGDELAAVLRGGRRGDMGWVGAIGVRRPWRQRGVGLALLRHAFADWLGRGVRRVGLGVDSQNPTGATRLYERAGMHAAYEAVCFEKAIA